MRHDPEKEEQRKERQAERQGERKQRQDARKHQRSADPVKHDAEREEHRKESQSQRQGNNKRDIDTRSPNGDNGGQDNGNGNGDSDDEDDQDAEYLFWHDENVPLDYVQRVNRWLVRLQGGIEMRQFTLPHGRAPPAPSSFTGQMAAPNRPDLTWDFDWILEPWELRWFSSMLICNQPPGLGSVNQQATRQASFDLFSNVWGSQRPQALYDYLNNVNYNIRATDGRIVQAKSQLMVRILVKPIL